MRFAKYGRSRGDNGPGTARKGWRQTVPKLTSFECPRSLARTKGATACSLALFVGQCVVLAAAGLGAKEVPVRLDLHATAGPAWPFGYAAETLDPYVVLDVDGRALIRKADVKSRIPRKYRSLVGDEIYIGHMLIPNALAFAANQDRNAWAFYIDWSPIGMGLIKVPRAMTHSAAASLWVGPSLIVGYQLFARDGVYLHSVRPGLELRADAKVMVAKPLSLKLSLFQKGYIPDMRRVEGERRNVMPMFGGAAAGIVVHLYTRRKI